MNTEKLNDWLQVIGLFAVVASLIFVGLQMRQTDAIALSQIYQDRAISSREATLASSNNPYYVSGLAKLYTGNHSELTAEEAIALEFELGSQLVMMDNHHQQHEWGYITEAYWSRTVEQLKCYFEHPWYRDALEEWIFRAEFQAVIDNAMADAVKNPTGCWDFDFPYPIGE